MSDEKKPPPSQPKATGSSGEHPAVVAFRQKLDSISESTMPLVRDLNTQIRSLKRKSNPPAKESRADRCLRCKKIVREEDDVTCAETGNAHEFRVVSP